MSQEFGEGQQPARVDLYKYRSASRRANMMLSIPGSIMRQSSTDSGGSPDTNDSNLSDTDSRIDSNTDFENKNDSKGNKERNESREKRREQRRTYAVLQETHSELTPNKQRRFLLTYSNPGWKLFIVVTLFISYILDTSLYTFFRSGKRSLWCIITLICFNLIFTLDVAIVVGLKFSKGWRKTLNLVEIDNTRVIIDTILALPYSTLYLFHPSNNPNTDDLVFDFHAIAPLIALLRIYRLIEYFYNKSLQAGSNQWSSFLGQYLILFVLSVHTWTCIWYLFSYRKFDLYKVRDSWSISAIYLPTETTFDWYFVCAYWSVMFLTTNALGDLYPVTTTERVMATLAILLGFVLTTVVFVGSLTSQFITITTRRSKYVSQLNNIQNHLTLIHMDASTTKRIIRYYEDLWYQKSGVFNPSLMKLLPSPMQMEICYDLNAIPLYSSLIFRKLPDAFLRRLSLAMSHRFYLPGDIVYDHNQNKTIMMCITNGVVELLSDEDDESPIISFTKGTCIGEVSLVYNIPARCTVKASTYVECQVLQKTQFIKLMVTYPDLVEVIKKEIHERIDRSRLAKKRNKNDAVLELNIYVSKDKRKSSIKCLKEKLRYLQGKSDVDTLTKNDELDENCLDLYIISDHARKKTRPFTCINSNFPWILESDCYLVKYWELFMLLLVFYVCIVYPYYIGIYWVKPDAFFYYAQIGLTVTLIVNVLITCTTAVKTKKKYIQDFLGIVNYRLNTIGFHLDIIAIIPLEYIVTIQNSTMYNDMHRSHLFLVCKCIKLCIVWRLSHFFEKLESKLLLNSLIVKVAKYCVYVSLLCYWCGIVLYMEACFVSRCSQDSWFSKAMIWEERQGTTFTASKIAYPILSSTYFATTLLLSVGYGDFTPGDKYDMGFVAFLSLYGVLFTGYCISEFSAVVTHWSRTKTAFIEVIFTIDKFMEENNMHHAIKNRIMAFYELQWQYNSGVELTDNNWLETTVVPAELRKKVLHQARFKALTSIVFFQVKNKAFIHTLTEASKDIILPPGEIVYYGGTVTRDLYIIESGYCLVTSDELRERRKERVIGPGNHLGLLVLLYGVPAVSTVITLTHCKLISISYSAYTSALSLFPDMREHDGLLTPEELNIIEQKAKSHSEGSYLKHYNSLVKSYKVKMTSSFQIFVNDSFINVIKYYNSRKENYVNSYKQFNFMNNILPYLLIPIVMKPDGLFLKIWSIFRVLVAFLLSIIIPMSVAMGPMKLFNGTVLALEIICYIDLYLKLHIAYYGPKNQLIYHPYLTAKHYLSRAFVLDLLTCFPWHVMYKLFVPKHDESNRKEDSITHICHCMIRMSSIFQIYKLYVAFMADSVAALKRVYLMSVLQFLLLAIFYLNFYTCILIMLSCRYVNANDAEDLKRQILQISLEGPYMEPHYHPDGNMICQKGSWLDMSKIIKENHLKPMKVYLLACYWTATSFSGAGFGDITAQNTCTIVLTIIVVVHGVLFFGYVYARIASLKAVADQVTTKFLENLKHLEFFMFREGVPTSLKKSIMEYWRYQWKRTRGWSHQKILGKLHANLNEDAVLYMYEKTLREIPLFENVENTFFRAFAKQLKEQYFQKGYMVTRAKEVMDNMYIIYRGKVDVISETNELEACMGPGGIFGNIRGASKFLTMSNIVASRNIDLLCIRGVEFYALLKSYPTVFMKVKYSVRSAVKDYVLPTIIMNDRMSFYLASPPSNYELGDDSDSDLDTVQHYGESPTSRSLADSQGSRSVLSISNAQYVSAAWLLFKPHKWFRSSIIPDCKWVQLMEYFILFLAYGEFMFLVYEMAFLSNIYIIYISIVTDFIHLYKVFLDMHTSTMNRYGDYILNPKKVRKNYFSKVYLRRRDFLVNIPICYLALTLSLKPAMERAFFVYLRAPQLFRISYLFTYKIHGQINIGSANLFVKLTTIIIWASILCHVTACMFFKLSCLTPVHCTTNNWMTKEELHLKFKYSEESYFPLYIASLWYMLNLITIAGMGDVSSQNDFEVVETIIITIIIKFCTGLLISEMSAMISAHSASLIAYDYSIHELRDGLKDMDLSEHQMNKMWDYVRELWNRQQGKQMPELVNKLPYRLRCQIMQAVYGYHIRDSVIFANTQDDFKRMVSMWLSHCVFFPGNYIVQCGDSDQCLYFIHRGEVEVLTVHANMTESIYDILGPEDSFGIAQGLFVGVPHHFSFRARTVVDIVYLKLDQWKYLLDFYPKSARIVQHKVETAYLAI